MGTTVSIMPAPRPAAVIITAVARGTVAAVQPEFRSDRADRHSPGRRAGHPGRRPPGRESTRAG